MVGGLALVVVSAAIASIPPWLMRLAIDGIRAHVAVTRTVHLALGMVGLALVAGALRYWMRELLNGVSRWIEYDLRNDLFAHLERLDASYYARTRTGDIMARLTNDLAAVRMAAGPAIMYLTNTVAGGVFALSFMLRISPALTGLALVPMLVLPILTVWLGRAIHTRFEAVQEHFSTLTTQAQENLAGARVVRAYRQEEAELERFRASSDEYLERNVRLAKLYGAFHPSMALLAGLAAATVLGGGGVLVVRGTISVGEFVAFGVYLAMLTWPLIALGWVINLFQRGRASMTRLNEILDAVPALPEPDAGRRLAEGAAGRTIEFDRVSFHYPAPADQEPRWVLRDLTFRVPAGTTLGVVGATGSGKTALMDLIPRLYDAQRGAIRIDGVEVGELSLATLRAEIGYVPQESLLFSDTIRANLVYGLTAEHGAAGPGDAPGDAGAAEWAARVAQLDDAVREFPGGYDTMLGERGINLSGGQKQRAALARALARHPRIVLLDDALSAVDTHTEAEILRALPAALAGRTCIIASHRVSAVRDADQILVLDEGRVVERGTHADLLALGGRYWSLLRRQQDEDAIDAEDAGDGDGGEPVDALAGGAPGGTIRP